MVNAQEYEYRDMRGDFPKLSDILWRNYVYDSVDTNPES